MSQLEQTPVAAFAVHPEVEQLELQVQAQLSGRIRRLNLLVVNGAIVLRGSARTYHAKQVAQHAVMRLTAQPILANEIEVT